MSYLLLLDDERHLVEHLTSELGLSLLIDDLAPRMPPTGIRTPNVAKVLIEAIPSSLPGPIKPMQDPGVLQFLFWRPDLGPLVAIGDPGRATDTVSRVGFTLSVGGADDWRDRVDQDRSALIRWKRCHWRENGHLTPGLLQGMAELSRLWPPELKRTHRSIERWLRKNALGFDAFDHCDDPPIPPPRNRSAFVVWARPAAAAWVNAGGRVWPWTG
jgi:hypothetical protein